MRATLQLPDKYAGMTKTEREWALQLEAQVRYTAELGRRRDVAHDEMLRHPQVVRWLFEPLAFRLAKGTTYRPDFYVLFSDGHVELQEVKQEHKNLKQSSSWKTSIVKFKVCHELYPEFVWVICLKQMDGSWKQTRAEDLFKRT